MPRLEKVEVKQEVIDAFPTEEKARAKTKLCNRPIVNSLAMATAIGMTHKDMFEEIKLSFVAVGITATDSPHPHIYDRGDYTLHSFYLLDKEHFDIVVAHLHGEEQEKMSSLWQHG